MTDRHTNRLEIITHTYINIHVHHAHAHIHTHTHRDHQWSPIFPWRTPNPSSTHRPCSRRLSSRQHQLISPATSRQLLRVVNLNPALIGSWISWRQSTRTTPGEIAIATHVHILRFAVPLCQIYRYISSFLTLLPTKSPLYLVPNPERTSRASSAMSVAATTTLSPVFPSTPSPSRCKTPLI